VLVFTRTKHGANNLAEKLVKSAHPRRRDRVVLLRYLPEHFSASRCCQSGVLAGGNCHACDADPGLPRRDGSESPDRFAAICTDFSGCVSGVSVLRKWQSLL